MPRVARKHILSREGRVFHGVNRINGFAGYYPFQKPLVIPEFIRRLRQSVRRCCIHCAGFVLMGNHYHLILFAEKFRELSRKQLEYYARARWGKLWKLRTLSWADQRWERFNQELFDLSILMRDFQGPFSTWFNKTFKRRGRLWADRFKCQVLGDFASMQEALLYVELNPVRAGLTALPKEWKAGSAYLRAVGEDGFLIPLKEIFPDIATEKLPGYYRALLLHRGMSRTREDQAQISAEIVAAELQRGFIQMGLYRKRCRFMIDGLVLGKEHQIRQELDRLTLEGVYRRRKNPTQHFNGLFFTVREQRSHCRW